MMNNYIPPSHSDSSEIMKMMQKQMNREYEKKKKQKQLVNGESWKNPGKKIKSYQKHIEKKETLPNTWIREG